MTLLEACVESLEEALAAEAGGAARVELCADLSNHGTTPDPSLLRACVGRLSIPVFVLVRPRAGHFVYSPGELQTMRWQILEARACGAAGIVTGALTPAGHLDLAALDELAPAAGNLPITFHRAFDRLDDRAEALETLIDRGIARVLTSGGAATALGGAPALAALTRRAAGRIVVIAGGTIRPHNVAQLVRMTGVPEVHAHAGDQDTVRALVDQLREPGDSR